MLRDWVSVKAENFIFECVSVVCDTPAQAFIRGVKTHTAYRTE